MSIPSTLRITPEFNLARIRPKHAKALFALIDKHRHYLANYVAWTDFHQRPVDTLNFVKKCEKETACKLSFTWVMVYQGKVIGSLSFNKPIDWQNKSTHIGYWLAPDMQGKGMVTQAILRLIDATCSTFSSYLLKCAVHNVRSNAVAKRCGFRFEKRLLQAEKIGEAVYDQNLYRLTPNS